MKRNLNTKIKQLIFNKSNFLKQNIKSFCSFKNKLPLNDTNFSIDRQPTHIEVILKDVIKSDLIPKKFLFSTESKIDDILSSLEKEYNIHFDLDNQSKFVINNKIKYDSFIPKNQNFLTELNLIKTKLNLTSQDKEWEIFLILFKDNTKESLNELKKTYFRICSQIEDMNKTKELIDRKVNFRVNIVFLALIAFLTAVTYIFYYCIYNVDELGWDLVEPVTYLFSSAIFLFCLFGYIKLQKKGLYSTTHLYSDLKNSLITKRHLMYNFNSIRYNELLGKKNKLWNEIQSKSRI
jgi:hypothetical protein